MLAIFHNIPRFGPNHPKSNHVSSTRDRFESLKAHPAQGTSDLCDYFVARLALRKIGSHRVLWGSWGWWLLTSVSLARGAARLEWDELCAVWARHIREICNLCNCGELLKGKERLHHLCRLPFQNELLGGHPHQSWSLLSKPCQVWCPRLPDGAAECQWSRAQRGIRRDLAGMTR